jgi:hypothetical protein
MNTTPSAKLMGLGILTYAITALCAPAIQAQSIPNPILFVTQFPIPGDFATIGSVFGNHSATTERAGRGGDLYIRYPDGTLRNLTGEAGYGVADGFQGATSIAVRDPAVHWSGTKAVFAMVVGAPAQQFQQVQSRWQLYEVAGLQQGGTAVITKLPNQPPNYNNIEPAYASDGDVIFSSDRPRNGAPHLYPQLDEYESRAVTTGLWRLDAATGALTLLQHSPSGSFTPSVDSFGRIVFTRWDHLQRDQQNDGAGADTFNYSGEGPESVPTADRSEVFPSPRNPPPGSNLNGHTFNQMFPWQLNQDGTEEETLNHIGRQELLSYFTRSFNDDPNLQNFDHEPRPNPNEISFALQIREDLSQPGRYLAIDAREFQEHASGQLIRFVAPPTANPAQIEIEYLTSRETYCCHDVDHPDNTGHYRNPLPLSNGTIVVAHTDYKGIAMNTGTRANPQTPFKFRLKRLASAGSFLAPAATLTPGISKNVSYYDPDVLVSYSGPFWELSPVEVIARPVPADTGFALRAPEQQAFVLEDANIEAFRAYLRANDLGVIVVRNATSRDRADKQQPYNLRVPGGVSSVRPPPTGRIYDIAHMQFFQGDQIRGGGGSQGRRVLAQYLHDPATVAANLPNPDGPPGSAPIFPDGSVALYVPTRRALAWQSTAPDGTPVVQERFWITLQPGEIRACDGCHGVNQQNQAGAPAASNVALAFRDLLARWNTDIATRIFASGFE